MNHPNQLKLNNGIIRLIACSILITHSALIAKQSKFKATLGYTTAVHEDLRSLPPPVRPVIVAVYNFKDQTGQYKTGAYGPTWSMAVTQGATSMLIKALEDSKWFVCVEREGLSDLMNERKIIATSREIQAQRNGEQPLQLPPLLYAGIILEGGIISYETNLISTGLGVRYFGLGGNTRLQQDRVTVYLRAVSSQTGEVIKTVHASKNILSEQLDGGLYRFIKFKKLLEVEAGISTNEPVQMCVLEAIEKAVLSLIVEGLIDSTWSLQNEKDSSLPVLREYMEEKETGNSFESASLALWDDKRIICQFTLGTQLTGAEGHRNAQIMTKIQLQYDFNPFFSGIIGAGAGKISGNLARSDFGLFIDFKSLVSFFHQYQVSPCLMSGVGVIRTWVKNPNSSEKPKYPLGFVPAFVCGCGIRYSVNKKCSIIFDMENHITTDDIDGLGSKIDSDNITSFSLGMSVAFTNRSNSNKKK